MKIVLTYRVTRIQDDGKLKTMEGDAFCTNDSAEKISALPILGDLAGAFPEFRPGDKFTLEARSD